MNQGTRVCAVLALAMTVGASACAKKKPSPPPAPPAQPATQPTRAVPPPPPPAPPREATPPAPTEDELFARKSLDEINNEHPLGDAFFALDSAQLGDDARPALQKDADWMKRWPSTKIEISGHCDSRGTAEYNLALGDRRAGAVKDYLVSLGISADRIQTVSKGKEQPFCADENESCWQQNRRGHFLVTAK